VEVAEVEVDVVVVAEEGVVPKSYQEMMDAQRSSLSHQRTHWTIDQLHDVEGDMVLERINKHSLLLSSTTSIVWRCP
jgi:hypothetical protein